MQINRTEHVKVGVNGDGGGLNVCEIAMATRNVWKLLCPGHLHIDTLKGSKYPMHIFIGLPFSKSPIYIEKTRILIYLHILP